MLSAYLAVRSHRTSATAYYIFLVAVLLSLQFVALQRSALVATVIGVGSLALASFRGRRATLALGSAIAVALTLVLLFYSPVDNTRLETAIARTTTFTDINQDSSLQRRLKEVWPAASKAISSQPIIGNGPGSAGVLTVQDPDAYRHGRLVTDNLFLHVTVQYGFLGLGLLVAFMAALGARLLRAQSREAMLARSLLWATLAASLVGTLLGLLNYTAFVFLFLGAASAQAVCPSDAVAHRRNAVQHQRLSAEVVCA
jgi:O-antigen ligase